MLDWKLAGWLAGWLAGRLAGCRLARWLVCESGLLAGSLASLDDLASVTPKV